LPKEVLPSQWGGWRVREPNPDSFVRVNPFVKRIENASYSLPASLVPKLLLGLPKMEGQKPHTPR